MAENELKETADRLKTDLNEIAAVAGKIASKVASKALAFLAPPGLQPLILVNAIYFQREHDPFEVDVNTATTVRYLLLNKRKVLMYYAGANSGCCDTKILDPNRPFVMNLFDSTGQPVFTITRPCTCSKAILGADIAGSEVEVRSTTGELFGSVSQRCHLFTPTYEVRDADNKTVLTIKGPGCSTFFPVILCLNFSTVFHIYVSREQAKSMNILNDGNAVEDPVMIGSIMKKFKPTEFNTDKKLFGMILNPLLDTRLKAVLIGATFCIDFTYYGNGCGLSLLMALYVVIFLAIVFVYIFINFF